MVLTIGLTAAVVFGAERTAGSKRIDEARGPSFWTYQDFLDGRIPPKYTVRKGHPRLLITPGNKKDIIAKIRAAPRLWQKAIRSNSK